MNPKVHIVPLNDYLKRVATLSVEKRLVEVVDIELLYSLMGATFESMKPGSDVLSMLQRIDLTRVIKDSEGINEPFACSIFADRTAWIYKNDNGSYRYYSRQNKGIYSFDLVDLLSIFRNEKRKEVFGFFEKKWGIRGVNAWHIEQVDRYSSNQSEVIEIQQNLEQYPHINKLIVEKHWVVLEKMIEFAAEKITGKNLAVNGKAVFFLSNNHLKETHFPKTSNSTVNNLINLFCILGLVRKIPIDSLPKELAKKAEVHYKSKRVLNHTSYYQMSDFKDVWVEAEKRAGKLIDNKIYYHRLSKSIVKELFGMDFANEIYVQHTFGNKGRAEPVYVKGKDTIYTESERLESVFLQYIDQSGKCSKRELANISLLSTSKFSIVWNNLIQKYHCIEKYPTKLEMVTYRMEKRLLIAVPERVSQCV